MLFSGPLSVHRSYVFTKCQFVLYEVKERCLVAWLREFCRTLEIIARTLREVVNRVRLCGHHTRGRSHGEVHVCGMVMQRGGEGGDR